MVSTELKIDTQAEGRLPKFKDDSNGPTTSPEDVINAERASTLARPVAVDRIDPDVDFKRATSDSGETSGGGALGWLTGLGKWLFVDGGILQVGKFICDLGVKFFEGVWDFAKSLFTEEFWSNVGSKLKDGFDAFMKNPVGAIWDGLKAIGKFALDSVVMPFKMIWDGITLIAQGRFTEGFTQLIIGVGCVALLASGVHGVLIGPILASRVLSQALARGVQGVLQTGVKTIAQDVGSRVVAAWLKETGLKSLFDFEKMGSEIADGAAKGARETAQSLTSAGNLPKEAVELATIERFKTESRELARARIVEMLTESPSTGGSLKDRFNNFKFKRRNDVSGDIAGVLDGTIQDFTLSSLHAASKSGKSASQLIVNAQERLGSQILTPEELTIAGSDICARLNQRGAIRVLVESGVDYYGADLLNRASKGILKTSLPVGKQADEMDRILKEELLEEVNKQLVDELLQEMEDSFEQKARIELSKIADEFEFSESFIDDGIKAGKEGLRDGIDDAIRPIVKESIEKAFRRFRPIVPRALPNLADPIQRNLSKKGVGLIPGLVAVNTNMSPEQLQGNTETESSSTRQIVTTQKSGFVSKSVKSVRSLNGNSIFVAGKDDASETNSGIADSAFIDNSGFWSDSFKHKNTSIETSDGEHQIEHRSTTELQSVDQLDPNKDQKSQKSTETRQAVTDLIAIVEGGKQGD